MVKRILPRDVFTPRRSEVNERMYVDRSELEEELVDALYGTNHILIHGESGTGKSWLYKHVFDDQGIQFITANLSNASRLKGLNAEFGNIIDDECSIRKTGYEEEKSATLNAVVGKGKITHKAKYELTTKEPFIQCLELLNSKAKNKLSCLVFDNFEQILDQPEITREVANCIVLLDDIRYSRYNVKILLVGVPNGIDQYFSTQSNVATIINRITEITEVTGLSKDESIKLPIRGFRDLLGYSCDNYGELTEKISYVTNRIPQQLHELCYSIAMQLERNGEKEINNSFLIAGANKWFKQSLAASYFYNKLYCRF